MDDYLDHVIPKLFIYLIIFTHAWLFPERFRERERERRNDIEMGPTGWPSIRHLLEQKYDSGRKWIVNFFFKKRDQNIREKYSTNALSLVALSLPVLRLCPPGACLRRLSNRHLLTPPQWHRKPSYSTPLREGSARECSLNGNFLSAPGWR